MKLAKNNSKIDKTHPLSVGMAAMHTTSSLHMEMLQISSFGELGYSSEHKYFTLLWNYTKTKILMCVLLLVSLVQKFSFWVLLWSSVCKNVPSDFAFPKHLLFICQNRANKTNTALSISIIPLIKAIFGLSGLEFCQKLQICMPNLVMLITHFGQKFKNPPPMCPSSYGSIVKVNFKVLLIKWNGFPGLAQNRTTQEFL